jgi:hypothetical protein
MVSTDNPFIYLRFQITLIEGLFETAITSAFEARNFVDKDQDSITDCGQLRVPDWPISHTFVYEPHRILCVCVCALNKTVGGLQ